jgi:hypothetical protein
MTSYQTLCSLGLSLSLFGLSGCSNPLEGSWVFQWDRANYQELWDGDHSDCMAPNDDGYPAQTRDGSDYTFVEIYGVRGEGLVVIHEGEEFIGQSEGKSFTVEAQFKDVTDYSDTTYMQYEWVWGLDGAYADGEMGGKEEREEWLDASGSDCHYKSRRSYTAVKLKTKQIPERGGDTVASDDQLGLGALFAGSGGETDDPSDGE